MTSRTNRHPPPVWPQKKKGRGSADVLPSDKEGKTQGEERRKSAEYKGTKDGELTARDENPENFSSAPSEANQKNKELRLRGHGKGGFPVTNPRQKEDRTKREWVPLATS